MLKKTIKAIFLDEMSRLAKFNLSYIVTVSSKTMVMAGYNSEYIKNHR